MAGTMTFPREMLGLISMELGGLELATMCMVSRGMRESFTYASLSWQTGIVKCTIHAKRGGGWAWVRPPAPKCFISRCAATGKIMVHGQGKDAPRIETTFTKEDCICTGEDCICQQDVLTPICYLDTDLLDTDLRTVQMFATLIAANIN